ncbi:MAG: hypothetical protein WD852_10455 [Methyloceanibacter sp.]
MDAGPLRTGTISRKGRTRSRNPAIPGLDGRTRESRRFRDLVISLAHELGHEPSTGELGLIRQASLSIVLAEALQVKALRGEASAAELGEIARMQNCTARCLIALGVKRKGNAAPDLDQYLRDNYGDARKAVKA